MPNEKKSILQPKNDVVFKALFSRGKPRITQAMLEAILKMKIDKLELDKSTDLLNENADDKNGRLDLRAIINGNTECDIEVQLVSNDNINERFLYYWAKMYAANLKIGDKYSDLRKTISIIILDDDFKLTKNLERPQTTWRIRESEATHLVLTDYFEIIIIEIPKVVKAYQKTPNDEVLQWMLFLDNPEKEEVARIMEENKDIKEAKEELERISQDDILRRKALNRTLEIADRLQMKKELKEAKADYIVQSVEELEKFLLRGSEELVNSNPDNKKKNPMYQRIWTMVYSFLMFILVRNAVQYALLALLYQLAQSGASGGLVDLLILRDETGAYNGYSGDMSSIIAALGFIGGALAVWSTAKLLITKNKEDMHLSHLKKEGKAKYALLVAATIGAVIGFNLLFELLGVTNKSEAYTEVVSQQYSAHFIVGILVFGFISPIAEELLFRGVIYGYLRRFMDLKLAIALSALIFGVYHMNYVQGIYGFLIGCLMAYAYEYFGEFKMAVFVHVASNVLAYCLSYTAIAVTGFVSWPVCVIFLTVAAVSLGMLHKQKNIF